MEHTILALGVNLNTNKVEQVVVSKYPWVNLKAVDLCLLNKLTTEFSNAYIGFDGTLINRGIELDHYTKYDIKTHGIIKRSFCVLLKSKTKRGDLFFITDGVSRPEWITLDKLYQRILSGNIRLANAKIVYKDDIRYVSSIKGEIQEVNYTEFALQYRTLAKI